METASTPAFMNYTLPHIINISLHILFGTAGLLLGIAQLWGRKSGAAHRLRGRIFLACFVVTITTATIGLVVFNFRAFLSVITLLPAYASYAGYRALKIRQSGPQLRDGIASIAALIGAGLLMAYIQHIQTPWNPVVIYSTIGTLVAMAIYDLLRFTFPRQWFVRLWLYEHMAKMITAMSALLSAFSGNMLTAWQPYSQILPSLLGILIVIGFVIYQAMRKRPAQ